jgi:hypothetical protein
LLVVEQGEIQIRSALDVDVNSLLAWKANPEVHEFYGGLEEAGEDFVRSLWREEWCLKGIITKAGVDVGYIQWYRLTPEIEASCLLEAPSIYGCSLGTSFGYFHKAGTTGHQSYSQKNPLPRSAR